MKHQNRKNNTKDSTGKLHALLFLNSVGSLKSHIELINMEGIVRWDLRSIVLNLSEKT